MAHLPHPFVRLAGHGDWTAPQIGPPQNGFCARPHIRPQRSKRAREAALPLVPLSMTIFHDFLFRRPYQLQPDL